MKFLTQFLARVQQITGIAVLPVGEPRGLIHIDGLPHESQIAQLVEPSDAERIDLVQIQLVVVLLHGIQPHGNRLCRVALRRGRSYRVVERTRIARLDSAAVQSRYRFRQIAVRAVEAYVTYRRYEENRIVGIRLFQISQFLRVLVGQGLLAQSVEKDREDFEDAPG